MTDDVVFTRDGAVVSFDSVETDGITVDDDGATFEWNEIPVVEVDEPPHARAFDTDQFYKIEDATVARPIKQPYIVNDEVKIFVKPADELRDMAWSLDNRPFTLTHPSTGMVKDVSDIHGFWRGPRYDDGEDRLKEDLYIPADDEDAKSFVEDNNDVSIGFYNRVYDEYDGDIGDIIEDTDDVDGFQTNMYGDHIAGVERGRCPSEAGCGLDDHDHGMVTDISASDVPDGADGDGPKDTTDQPSGIKVEDGTWYAVGPGEHTKDSTSHAGDHMFPVDNCSDVEDAWGLRNNAKDLSISQETLNNRIQRAGDALDCAGMPWMDEDSIEVSADYDPGFEVEIESPTTTMADEDFNLPDLAVDALAEKHEGVAGLVSEKDEIESTLAEVRDALGVEEECDCVVDEAEELAEKLDDYDSIKERLDEYEESERSDKLEYLVDELEADEDEWEDAELDEIEDEIDRREDLIESFDVQGAETGGSGEGTTTVEAYPRGHAA